MVGAVAGTPGTLPTNWTGNAATDLTREVVGTGTENGIAYIDLKFTGTVAASRTQYIFFEPGNVIAASNGQSWTGSTWAKIVAGSLANITSVAFQANTRNASLVYVSTPFTAAFTPTSTFTRYSGSGTATGATIAWIESFITFITASSGAIDITLRIGLPQLEQGAFATSVIPTTTAAVTRSADVASITGSAFSGWYRQDEGTVFAQVIQASEVGTSRFPRLWSISDGTFAERITGQRYSTGTFRPNITDNSVGQAVFDVSPSIPAKSPGRFAYAFKLDDIGGAVNGGAVVTDTSATMPLVTQLNIGDVYTPLTTTNNNGPIRRLTYWPQRLGNEVLQRITQ